MLLAVKKADGSYYHAEVVYSVAIQEGENYSTCRSIYGVVANNKYWIYEADQGLEAKDVKSAESFMRWAINYIIDDVQRSEINILGRYMETLRYYNAQL